MIIRILNMTNFNFVTVLLVCSMCVCVCVCMHVCLFCPADMFRVQELDRLVFLKQADNKYRLLSAIWV